MLLIVRRQLDCECEPRNQSAHNPMENAILSSLLCSVKE
jgi:hypothetical protein